MNYKDLSGYAFSQPWAAKYKTEIDQRNSAILADRQKYLDSRTEIGIGDFVRIGDKVQRVAHNWGDRVQLTDGIYGAGASFYLGDGFVEFSGGLNPGIPIEQFRPTEEKREGSVWFFSQNHVEAHNGYHTSAMFRVWEVQL